MDKLILLALVVCVFVATCESFAKDPEAKGRYYFLNHKDLKFSQIIRTLQIKNNSYCTFRDPIEMHKRKRSV